MTAFAGCGFENLGYGRSITFICPAHTIMSGIVGVLATLVISDGSLVVISSSCCLISCPPYTEMWEFLAVKQRVC